MAKNWAIAIGINHYQFIPDLNYAQADAEAMTAWMLNEGGFDQNRVFLFTPDHPTWQNRIPTEPTFGCLRNFLKANINEIRSDKLLTQADNFWFFFSGHGVRTAQGDYLMLRDSSPLDVQYTAIPVNYITERLRYSGAVNIFMFLDACRENTIFL